jgi:AsmA family protein
MSDSLIPARIPKSAALLLAAFAIVCLTIGLLAAAVNAGYFRGYLLDTLAARSGRGIQVTGSWQVRLFSWHPRVTAGQVIIRNPPWTSAGTMAQIGKVSLTLRLPWFHRPIGIERLELEGANLHLIRDSAGRANWQLTDPDKGGDNGLPLIRSLSIQNARVELADARRHLQFNGTVSVDETGGAKIARPLQIDGSGQLNGRAATFGITGDPLSAVDRDMPYRFTFTERSSGSRLDGQGALLRPFKFDAIDASFEAVGEDLKDLYFLTGVTLVNTGGYRLSATLARRGTNTTFSDLRVTSGESDVRGRVAIDSASARSKLAVDLESNLLRMSDLGVRAAGRESKTAAPMLLPDAVLNPEALRRTDATVNFHALAVAVGRVSLRGVSARMSIERGIVTVAPLRAGILEGKLNARVRLDATKDLPPVDIDLRINDAQISQLPRKDAAPAPFEGRLQARLTVRGEGLSMHQVAASANGTLTAVLPHGTIRASLAEIIGLDLRGLGLLASKSSQDTGIRCGIASFQARQGVFTAENFLLDTDTVQITGDGLARLDSESLDFRFRGHPKGVRLARLRSPILLGGTLARPTIRIDTSHLAAQAVEAVAAGVVLTPIAAVLAFVDPGLTKDADCGALISEAALEAQKNTPMSAALRR